MPWDQTVTWHLECNGKTFYNKLEAIAQNTTSGQPIHFITSKKYDDFDFSIEPSDSLEQLCVAEAKALRNCNEEVFLFYSGGSDSHYILQTFLDNNIKLDKIVMVKSGYRSADFEIDDYALPFIKKLDIPFEVRCPDQKYYHDFYMSPLQFLTQNEFWHHFRLNNHFENLKHSPEHRVNIFGKEKPKLVYEDNKWYTYFMDVEVTNQPNQHNFYIENPAIYSKQCHMLKNKIESQKDQTEYNHITHYNENQDFWNRSIGRYDKEIFPLKLLNENGCFSNKDYLAIQSAEPRLVTAWKRRNAKLVERYGTHWFNQGEPSLGTIGVFSKFYCLSEKDTKTVDDLYADGFKIQ